MHFFEQISRGIYVGPSINSTTRIGKLWKDLTSYLSLGWWYGNCSGLESPRNILTAVSVHLFWALWDHKCLRQRQHKWTHDPRTSDIGSTSPVLFLLGCENCRKTNTSVCRSVSHTRSSRRHFINILMWRNSVVWTLFAEAHRAQTRSRSRSSNQPSRNTICIGS